MENGQVRATSLDHLDYCCQLVSELYGKPDIAAWTNSDYVRLGYVLYKKTHVQISPNTLKRIFGKIKTDVRYYPQRATRDALARYIGYGDWEHFKAAKPLPEVAEIKSPEPVTIAPPVAFVQTESAFIEPKKPRLKLLLLAIATVFALGALIYYQLFMQKPEPTGVSLHCENPVGENPHSAVFVVRGISSLPDPKERYTIEFGDRKKTDVAARDSLYTHYYEVPGRYSAVLKHNGNPVDTVSVYLKTTGWTATAEMMYDTTRVYPVEVADLLTGGKKSVSAAEVSRAGIDTNRTFFVKFVNTQLTGIDGDNFDLKLNLKTSPTRPGVRCSQVRLTVFGESSNHIVDAMKPGCVHWTNLQFSEINKPGESNKLNFLGVDLHEGGSLGIRVAEQHAQVFINEKQVYETDYKKPLNKIYGIAITFSGIGTINSLLLKDLKTGKIFDGSFD